MEFENKDIEKERKRRIEMWDQIKKIEKEQIKENKFLTSSDIRKVGCYGGGRGIWRDALKTTGSLTPDEAGICIGILSTGKYDDNIDGESGKYDYPSTDVEGYDDGDIKSLRWAFKFDLPIFLVQNLTKDGKITTKKGAPFRKIDLIKFIDDCPYDNHLVFTSSEGGKDAYFLQEDIPKSCFQQRALKVSTNKKKKRSQAAFRAAVIKRFEFCKCVLCDAPKEVIEAAHIIPVEDNGSDWDQNGILLCKNHHSLFDKGLWAIDPDYFEIIPLKNNDLSKMQIHRSNIRHLEIKPAQEALIWRWNDFQKRVNPDKN